MADQPPRLLAGARVLGAFDYASRGTAGWHVAHQRDLDGLTDDAVAEGTRLIERLPWWPTESLSQGTDAYERPRRLAWLGSGTTPRRFLVHTIHAENDASNRPDNNYSECLVVGRGSAAGQEGSRDHRVRHATPWAGVAGEPVPTTRPSQMWDLDQWATPWGAEAVATTQPSLGPRWASRGPGEVLQLIQAEPTGQLRLRTLLAGVHRAIHRGGPPVIGWVDDLVWGAALLDTALALLPAGAAWEATFDLRSLAPSTQPTLDTRHRAAALINLYGREHPPTSGSAEAIDLTSHARAASLEPFLRLDSSGDCGMCGPWFASVDRLLKQDEEVTPELLDRQLTALDEGLQRRASIDQVARTPAPGRPDWADPPPPAAWRAESDGQQRGGPPTGPSAASRHSEVDLDPGPQEGFETADPRTSPAFGHVAGSTPPRASADELSFTALDHVVKTLRAYRLIMGGSRNTPVTRARLLAMWQEIAQIVQKEIELLQPPPAALSEETPGHDWPAGPTDLTGRRHPGPFSPGGTPW